MMTSQNNDGPRSDDWIDALLRKDAATLQGADDSEFTAVVMKSLGSAPRFELNPLVGVALSGLAAGVTALCITWQLPSLLNAIVVSVHADQPQQLLAASTPFALLVGLSWLAYRVGASSANDPVTNSYA
jgi:hypothetical protein